MLRLCSLSENTPWGWKPPVVLGTPVPGVLGKPTFPGGNPIKGGVTGYFSGFEGNTVFGD